MSDLDTDDDSTDKRENIDGTTLAKIKPRIIPKKHGRSSDIIRIWAFEQFYFCETLFTIENDNTRRAGPNQQRSSVSSCDMENWRKICVIATNLKADAINES